MVVFTGSNDDVFVKAIDELVLSSPNDSKLKNAIKYIEKESQLRGQTLYQMIYDLMQKDIIEERARQWINKR